MEEKPYTRRPYPPFMTSTLQQEAGRKLRFTSERTMSVAQRLYENGHITYMRTDSTTLSQSAIDAARNQARQLYGEEYVHPSPRQYTRKVKNAQEAHEAIRPAGDTFATPGALHRELDADEFRLYELIWQRTVASQMADARGTTLSLRIAGTGSRRARGRRSAPAGAPSPSPASSRPTSRPSTSWPAARPTTPRAGCRSCARASGWTPPS